MKLRDSFHPYAALTILFWSLAYVLTRFALKHFSVFSLGFLRYFSASCALLVMIPIFKIKPPKKADVKWFLVSGFFGFFLYVIAFNKGCETVTAATSSVIIACVPVITAILARVFYHEKLGVIKWTAIVIEFTGVTVLTLMNHAFSLNHGIIWLLLASVSLGVYNLLQRKLTKTYSGFQASSYSIFLGTAMLAVFLPTSIKEVIIAPPYQLLYVAILGVFSSAIAFVSWAQAFKKAGNTSSVSNYMFVTPFLTALLGFIIADEQLDMPTITGGMIILTGVLIFNFGDKLYELVLHRRRCV
ncbi:MAG: DMT family transporter [Acetivibrionales bacterium]|jgi:drug/metabolite transporter (DMT)-like permease